MPPPTLNSEEPKNAGGSDSSARTDWGRSTSARIARTIADQTPKILLVISFFHPSSTHDPAPVFP